MIEFVPAIQIIDECQNNCLGYLTNKYNMTDYQYDEISDMIFNCLSDAQEDVPTPYFLEVIDSMTNFIMNNDFATIYKTSVSFNNDECKWYNIVIIDDFPLFRSIMGM